MNRVFGLFSLIFAAALSLIFVRYNGFWIDELYTLHTIRLPFGEMVMERFKRGHFPLYFALVRVWYSLFDPLNFEVVLRAFSLLGFALATASFFLLARRGPSPAATWIAVTLFVLNGLVMRQAVEARMYTWALLIAVWITRAYMELRAGNTRWGYLLCALTAIGIGFSPSLFMLIIGLGAEAFLTKRIQSIKWLIAAAICGLLILLPGAYLHVSTADRLGVASAKPLEFLTYPFMLAFGPQIADDYFNTTPWHYTALAAAIALCAALIFTIRKTSTKIPAEAKPFLKIAAAPLLLCVAIWPIAELFSISNFGPPRYYISLLPAAALAIACIVTHLPRPQIWHAALLVVAAFSSIVSHTTQTEAFRDTIQYLAKNRAPKDAIVVVPHEIEDGVELYLDGAQTQLIIDRWRRDEPKMREQLQALSSHPRIWLVWYRGSKSPVYDLATQLWGDPISNRPDKPRGDLRVFAFTPPVMPSN